MTKKALLRFAVFSFLGQTHFQWKCYGHFYDSIKIAIFKTLRRLFVYTYFTKKNIFELLMLAVTCSASHRPASWEALISKVPFSS